MDFVLGSEWEREKEDGSNTINNSFQRTILLNCLIYTIPKRICNVGI